MNDSAYNPFERGGFPVGVRTFRVLDGTRDREFPIELWYPASAAYAGQDLASETQDTFTIPPGRAQHRQMAVRDATPQGGTFPLILYSHGSGGSRRIATFLCTHLSSHAYVVAALDHSEVVEPELAWREGETAEQRAARSDTWIANRVPDMKFLMKSLIDDSVGQDAARIDASRVGLVGFSFGGWTVLATPDVEARIHAVVALAPGGASQPKPGILPVKLRFDWGRDVPTLYLAGESDIFTPPHGILELMQRTPSTKRMISLAGADHMHFIDDAEQTHEAVRKMKWADELAWVPTEIRPFAELCTEDAAHAFVRGLTLAHMDAALKGNAGALAFLSGDIETELARLGIRAREYSV